jgi:N-acetylglutamate synthase-like GNAT family acetyltransferase
VRGGVEVVRSHDCARDVERLLALLPEWFGLEASNRGYVEAARTLPSYTAVVDDEVVGVCLLRDHNPDSVEIELVAVDPTRHRAGIGRAILDRVEADLHATGVRLLSVKTFGPSGVSGAYARTREFYVATGFVPLEERTDIWGPENPCLIMVKPLD